MSPTTLAALAARLDMDEHDLEHILLDSERLGLVQRDEHGRWGLTPDTEARFGRALRALGPAASGNGDGGRGIGHAPAENDPGRFRERQETLTGTGGMPSAGGCAGMTPNLAGENGARELRENCATGGARD